MIRRPQRSTLSSSSAASDVYKRQELVAGQALLAGHGQVADPGARIGLLVDASADLDRVAVALAAVDILGGGDVVPVVEGVLGRLFQRAAGDRWRLDRLALQLAQYIRSLLGGLVVGGEAGVAT